MTNLDHLIKLAHSVRRRAETEPQAYPDLEGYCGLASKYLALLAGSYGLEPTLICAYFQGWSHCWVEYCGKIIDVTATQFNGSADVAKALPKVLVTNVSDSRYMHRIAEVRSYRKKGNPPVWRKDAECDRYPYRAKFHNDWLLLEAAQHLHRGRRGKLLTCKLKGVTQPAVRGILI